MNSVIRSDNLVHAPWNKPRTSEDVGPSSGDRLGPMTKVGRTVTRSILCSLANSQAAFSARIFATAYHIYGITSERDQTLFRENVCTGTRTEREFGMECSTLTWRLSQYSMELHDVSSSSTLGGRSASSLILTVEDEDVRTTLLREGFFLHDRSTFRVPFIAELSITSCKVASSYFLFKT